MERLRPGIDKTLDLLETVPRFILPGECYIWLRERHPWWLRGLTGLLTPLIIFWTALLLLLPDAIAGLKVQQALYPESGVMPTVLLFGLGLTLPPLVLLLVRLLVHALWKPSPEMLRQNAETVAEEEAQAEAEEDAQEDLLISLRRERLQPWICKTCGQEVSGATLRCPHCNPPEEDIPEDEWDDETE